MFDVNFFVSKHYENSRNFDTIGNTLIIGCAIILYIRYFCNIANNTPFPCNRCLMVTEILALSADKAGISGEPTNGRANAR